MSDVETGIRDFWSWWTGAQHRVFHAIEAGESLSNELIAEISLHVEAIGDLHLDWELAPGKTSRHAFCLSPKGDPEARLVTELWRHNGPEPDANWEYFAARQAAKGSGLAMYGVKIDRNELMVSYEVDEGCERIHADYFHPAFAKLDDDERLTALYLLLDALLGEDGVERWLGRIRGVTALRDGVPFARFEAALAELERTGTGERFAILKGETDTGAPLIVTCNRALKRIDHIMYTMHVSVDLAILDQNAEGLTTPDDAAELDRLEDELYEALAGVTVYFGRETVPGHRSIHWYAPEDSAAQAIIDRWSARHPERRPRVEWIRDPRWTFVDKYA